MLRKSLTFFHPSISSVAGAPAVANPTTASVIRSQPRYRVLIHNDDITPMHFVVHALTRFFKKETADAISIMLEAHHEKIALVDVMGLEEAEFRLEQAHALARTAKYPLTFSIEPN